MPSVTITDVARRAGVSVATVSRVMSASRPVGREVEVRVRRAAADLGYSANGIARALRRNRTDTVGMVVPSILNPFFTTLVDSMERALHAEGKQLFLCDSRQDPDVEAQHLRSLIERHVDGIVVSPCHMTASAAAVTASARQVPLVQLDRHVALDRRADGGGGDGDGGGIDWVGLDDDEALRLLLAHLHAAGARSAAFVTSELTNSSTKQRLAGFRRHASDLGFRVDDDWIVLGDYTVDSGDEAAGRLLDGAARPDAIVCADDLIAIGVLRGCRERGVRVPEDVQVTGFDDIVFSEHVTPSLTTVDQPTHRMAREAIRLLQLRTPADPGARARALASGVAEEPAPDAVRIALRPRLVVRQSTRAV
jgi:LacI family transcriptional regulator